MPNTFFIGARYRATCVRTGWMAAALCCWMLLAAPRSPAEAADCGGERPCSCGDRVVESYRLTTDLGPCPRNGLEVVARVVLDGGGHHVRGSGARGSSGVSLTSPSAGSEVSNLEISGFERGLRLRSADRVRVVAVHAHHNGDFQAHVGYGIDLAGGSSDNVIERARVEENADEGIHVGRGSNRNRIRASTVSGNFRENVYFLDNSGSVLEASRVTGGRQAAVYMKEARSAVVKQNQIEGPPIVIRGASVGIELVDNEIRASRLVVDPFHDEKLGFVRPDRVLLRGGRIAAPGTCVVARGLGELTVDGARLECPNAVSIAGGSRVVVVDATLVAKSSCEGDGTLIHARRVATRLIDDAGRPIPDVEVRIDDRSAGRTDEGGVFRGLVPTSGATCPSSARSKRERITLSAGHHMRVIAPSDVGDRLILASR